MSFETDVTGLKAPFPWFGGKRRVAAEAWRRLGPVPVYVEPFFGSGAVLLGRPGSYPAAEVETVNDADGLLSNFWRAVAADPDEVWHHADWPVNEADLHARHLWLVGQRAALTERLIVDPDWYDAKAAGWWVWGACAWIGDGWCSGEGPWRVVDGLLTKGAGRGINRTLPHLGDDGQGINRTLPHLGNDGRGINRPGGGPSHPLSLLGARLRRVRVACGGWERVTGDSVLNPCRMGRVCGVFLDPPYGEGDAGYAFDSLTAATDSAEWARDAAKRLGFLRVAWCGYRGAAGGTLLDGAGWARFDWHAKGGYGSMGAQVGRTENASREAIWFSPSCEASPQLPLFSA